MGARYFIVLIYVLLGQAGDSVEAEFVTGSARDAI
jgi:hypothetical protein